MYKFTKYILLVINSKYIHSRSYIVFTEICLTPPTRCIQARVIVSHYSSLSEGLPL